MPKQARVGIIGCGNISSVYFQAGRTFDILDIVACADIDVERAKARAAEFGIPRACTPEELLADPSIEIVINLTIPKAHASVALAAIEAGKSVYNEKPLAITREDGQHMLKQAKARGVLVGGAPDTFMGAGIQTCRQLIDEGAIGRPLAASANMLCHGHESWHPDPAFYYQVGGGPMFDMGPYYLTALVNLLGPVQRVSGSTRISFPERTITSQPRNGQKIQVEVPTHITGLLDFAQGATGTLTTSFDIWAAHMPIMEIYGSEGTLSVPDPNGFGGPVRLWQTSSPEWREISLTRSYSHQSRGLGVADMAYALHSGRPHRASGELAYHVLDIMHAIHDAASEGRTVTLESSCARPAPLPANLIEGQLDE